MYHYQIGKSVTIEPVYDFSLNFQYVGRKTPALSQTNGIVERGKFIVLCGASGCGKTTLIRVLNHLVPDFYHGSMDGYCRIHGCDMKNLSISETGLMASTVFQNPQTQFFTLNTSSELAFGLENQGTDYNTMRQMVDDTFQSFGLEKLQNRNVNKLSAGEKQLTALMAASIMGTEIILLDEPTANLDLESIELLKRCLQNLKAQGKTIIISEHRLYFLRDIADTFWYMQKGRIVRQFTAETFCNMSSIELAKLSLRLSDVDELSYSTSVKREGKLTFRASGIQFSYCKRKSVLKNINLSSEIGYITGILGRNGCGKTSLGKVLTGIYKSPGAVFHINGKVVSRKELLASSLFVMQEHELQFFSETVLDEICSGNPAVRESVEMHRWMERMGLWYIRDRDPVSLSGGQMQKMALLQACFSGRRILVFDEPSAGMDYDSLQCCRELMREVAKDSIIFIITHDPELLSGLCDRCLLISDGVIAKEYDSCGKEGYRELIGDMRNGFSPFHEVNSTPSNILKKEQLQSKERASSSREKYSTDPRINLLYLLPVFVSSIIFDHTWIIACIILLTFQMLLNGQRKGMIGMLPLFILGILPYISTSGWAVYFSILLSRAFVTGISVWLTFRSEKLPGILSLMRKVKLPEKLIMILAVFFRYFPVLKNDLRIMQEVFRTRGLFVTIGSRIRHFISYAQLLVVPLIIRTIRVAESLTAAAMTRGIESTIKRSSYIQIRMTIRDYAAILFMMMVVAARVFGLLFLLIPT